MTITVKFGTLKNRAIFDNIYFVLIEGRKSNVWWNGQYGEYGRNDAKGTETPEADEKDGQDLG